MEVNLYYLSYNNYFNRIIRRELTLREYLNFPCSIRQKVAFNPNDGIETEIKVNWKDEDTFIPDYLVVASLGGVILSKWFITDFVRTRSGQFSVSLKRDVISDNYDAVINAPCFLEKGFVPNDNPLVFNKEDFQCNQIKKSEEKLHDNTYISWLIAYYNISEKSQLQGDVTTIEEPYITIGVENISSWNMVQRYHDDGYNVSSNKRFSVDIDMVGTTDEMRVSFDTNADYSSREFFVSLDTELEYDSNELFAWNREAKTIDSTVSCINSNKTSIKNALNNFDMPVDSYEAVFFYNGKIVKTNDGKFYRIFVRPITTQNISRFLDVSGAAPTTGENALVNALSSSFKVGGAFKTGWSGNFNKAFYMQYTITKYSFEYVEITNSIKNYHYDFRNVKDIIDAPYGIIALPFKAYQDYIKIAVNGDTNYIVNELAMEIIRDMTKDGIGGSNKIFDVQILPFCPITRLLPLFSGNKVNFRLTNDLDASEYTIINDSNNNLGTFALHPTTCKFTLNISKSLSVQNVKFENQCEFYRLCSPNWASCFEFNLARNGGISYFNVDCTYKPYQPYVHINPNFNLLYGQDFNDARGLIFSGDFSISSISSAFETYALNNKNYQEMFNRQIENLDANYDIQQRYRTYATAAGVIGSGAAAMGGLAMGHPAAALGGVIGVASSAYSGFAGWAERKERHQEERDYAIDQHNFQLENIKAKPDTLTKVSAYNNNNKIFPVLEKYSCTDEEKQIFLDKIKYEGMTINAIGKIKDYINNIDDELTFVKGKLIRLEELAEDSHLLYVIYDEISKGVYLNGR